MSVELKQISNELPPLLAQVTFRDKPLSYYLLNTEAAGNRPRTCLEDDVQRCRARSCQEELLTGLWFLSADILKPAQPSTTYILPVTFPSDQVRKIRRAGGQAGSHWGKPFSLSIIYHLPHTFSSWSFSDHCYSDSLLKMMCIFILTTWWSASWPFVTESPLLILVGKHQLVVQHICLVIFK